MLSLFIILYGRFKRLTNFSEQMKNNLSPKYQAKHLLLLSSHSFLNLILIIAHDLKPSRKYKHVFVTTSHNKILNYIF